MGLVMDTLQKLLKEKNADRSLVDRLYRELLRDILTGYLPAGSRLVESRLCHIYSVSRTPLREAFRLLEADGLAEYIPNRGEFVRGLNAEAIPDLFVLMADLEVRCVGWAAERIREETKEELAQLFSYMEFYTVKNDIPKMVDINQAFHRIIYQAAGNTMLEKALTNYQIYSTYACPPNYFARRYLERTLEEHRQIYVALLAQDRAGAIKAMRIHMAAGMKRSLANRKPSFE